jgi:hypothetical protein
MKSKAVAVQPLNSLNLRSILPTRTVSRDVVHPTKPTPTQPLTFADVMFAIDDVSSVFDDLTEDLELDNAHSNHLLTLLKPDTPIGAAVSFF